MSDSAGDKSEEPPTTVEGTGNGTAEEPAPDNDSAGDKSEEPPTTVEDTGNGTAEEPAPHNDSAGDKSEEPPTTVEGTGNGTAEEPAPDNSTESSPPPPARPKYRHDWYQTESDVRINILIKKVKKENMAVDFQEKSVCATIV